MAYSLIVPMLERDRRYSRRTFVAWVGGASAGFYLFGRLPGTSAPIALAQIPGGTLDPNEVDKFVTPMLIPPVMPRAATITQPGGKRDSVVTLKGRVWRFAHYSE